MVTDRVPKKCKHDWHWGGGGLVGEYDNPNFPDQMYCKKECTKCHVTRKILESRDGCKLIIDKRRKGGD